MSKKKRKKISKTRYHVKIFLKLMVLVLLIVMIAVGLMFYFKYGKTILKMQSEAKKLVRESTEETFRQSETSLIYDSNGKIITSLKGEKDMYYLTYEDIPKYAKDAMISIEDKNFMTHNGVDFKANVRAVLVLIKNKGQVKQGASTITQQLSRNIFLSHQVSWERKLKEIFISTEMEKKYKKYEILEFYLNNIYFANGYYGIQAASKGYFSCNVDKLSLSQIAFLCAIPNNPTLYDPLERPENTIKRRDRILKQMLLDEKISQEEYDESVSEEISLKESKKLKKRNYVETYAIYCATRSLMEARGFEFKYKFNNDVEKQEYDDNYDEIYNECQHSLYTGGYRIHTSINLNQQATLQESVDDVLSGFTDKTDEGVYKLQGAAVSVDNETGRVVAIVGGRSQKSEGYTLNRAYQSFRQPGSSIKPLIVYTPAFINGYSPEQTVNDVKLKDGPRNSGNSYLGKISLRTAVEKSKNTVAWQIFEDITPKVGLSYLLDMNFSKIQDSDYYLAASLGGFTIGVSPVEMASGYAALENDGFYRKPTCIVKITDAEGKEIVSDKISSKPVYDSNAARMMTDVMTGVMKRGTGAGLGLSNMPCAGKTGTTNDKKDGWFVGYTPYYTTSVWVGYDQPQTLNDLYGSTYPGRIWKQYMEAIHENLERKEFLAYEGKSKPKVEETPEPEESLEPALSPEETTPPEKEEEVEEEEVVPTPDEETDTGEDDYGDIIPPEGDIPVDDSDTGDIPEEDTGEIIPPEGE